MILFETRRIEQEYRDKRIHPLLLKLLADAEDFASIQWGWDLFLTCLWRSKEGDDALGGHGVHVAWRAADVRTIGVNPKAVVALDSFLNARWVYDQTRPQFMTSDIKPHGTAFHLHAQVHPNTIRRVT